MRDNNLSNDQGPGIPAGASAAVQSAEQPPAAAGTPAPAPTDANGNPHPVLAELEHLLKEVERLVGLPRMSKVLAFAERIRSKL